MIVAVIAKAPVPGRVKTRLCPPCSPEHAADLAAASLADVFDAVAAAGATRHVAVFDGDPGAWVPDGFEVLAQRGRGLDARLAAAFADLGGPALIVGMDTPQLTTALVQRALDALADADAVLGPAADGGYWCIGLRSPDPAAVLHVPMSRSDTCAAQRERFRTLRLRWTEVDELRDMDTYADARAIARLAPGTRMAAALGAAVA